MSLSELSATMRGLSSFRKSNFITLAAKTAESISNENGQLDVYRNSLEKMKQDCTWLIVFPYWFQIVYRLRNLRMQRLTNPNLRVKG